MKLKVYKEYLIINNMEEKLDAINMSNLEVYKSQSKDYKHALNKIFFACLRELPRELLIEGLKKKKIIQRDWEQKGAKYIEVKKE